MYKKSYKTFCFLPKQTPNQLVNSLIGNLEEILNMRNKQIKFKQ